MEPVTYIGLFAATCTTFCQVPQLTKAIKTQSTQDVSLWMYIILLAGVSSWLMYGILIGDMPLIAANAVSTALVFIVLMLKLRFG
jgi:MtN3 and saliva related transmembrane protein